MASPMFDDDDQFSDGEWDAKVPREGTIKGVIAGDVIVVAVDSRSRGADRPRQRTIQLMSLIAPHPAYGKDDEEEPCGWESREFLRSRYIGRRCMVQVFARDRETNADVGVVTVDGTDLAAEVVAAGWSTVSRDDPKAPAFSKYEALEKAAEKKTKGLWAPGTRSNVRKVDFAYDRADFFKSLKGTPSKAIVEGFGNPCHIVRVCFVPSWRYASIVLEGVACPDAKKKEPGAADARRYIESRIMHQEVTVNVSQHKGTVYFGTIIPKSDPGAKLQKELLERGLARIDTKTLQGKPSRELVDAEKAGRSKPAARGGGSTKVQRGAQRPGSKRADKSRGRGGGPGNVKSPRPGSKAVENPTPGAQGQEKGWEKFQEGEMVHERKRPPSNANKRLSMNSVKSINFKGDVREGKHKRFREPSAPKVRERGESANPNSSQGGRGGGGGGGDEERAPKPSGRNPKDQSNLRAAHPWDRTVALATLQPQDLFDRSKLVALLGLMEDTSWFTLPKEPYSDAEKAALRLCHVGENLRSRWLTVVPNEYQPDVKKEGEQRYWVADMAMRVMLKAPRLPCKEPETMDALLEAYIKNQKKPWIVRKWIDLNFTRFQWIDEDAAIKHFCSELMKKKPSPPMIIDFIMRDAEEDVMEAVATAATRCKPPAWHVLVGIHRRDHRGDLSADVLLAVMEKASGFTFEALDLVAKIGSKEEFRNQAVKVLRKAEGSGNGMAGAFLAIWGNPDAGKRFGGWIQANGQNCREEDLRRLIRRAHLYLWPKEFPAIDVLPFLDSDWVMRGLCDAWADEMHPKLKERILRRLADGARHSKAAYEPLFELGKLGALTKDKALADRFFKSLRDVLKANDEWSLTPEAWDIEGHPVVFFSHPNSKPLGYDEGVLMLLNEGLIPASVVAYALRPARFKPWEIADDGLRSVFAKAAAQEIGETEKEQASFERKNPRGIRHPSETPLWNLKERWTPMRGTLVKSGCDGANELAKRIDALVSKKLPRLIH